MSARTLLRVHSILAATLVSTAAYAQTPQQDPDPAPPDESAAPPHEPTAAPVGALGYAPGEGFRLKSDNGDFLLRLALQAAFAAEPTWTNGDSNVDSAIRVLRPVFRGHIVEPWIGYWVSIELSKGTPYLLDGYLDIKPWDELGFRFGQQYTPMSRHEAFGPQQIFFPDFARTANYFWSGYEKGATLYGATAGERFYYYAGFYGGSPLRDTVNVPQNFVVEGRATISPFGPVNANELPFTPKGEALPLRLSFTLQGFLGKIQTAVENYNPGIEAVTEPPTAVSQRTYTAGGDVWLQGGPLILFGEFYWRSQRPENGGAFFSAYGAWGQAIANVYKNKLGVGARLNWIEPNHDLSHDRLLSLEGQVAWFVHAPELVLKARYAWIDQLSPDAATLGTFRLPDVAGTSHVATLQMNLSF